MVNQKEEKILLIVTGDGEANAEEAAFRYARSNSRKLVVLQILTSNLYHYGHHDIIATRPSKRQFLLHIREEVLRQGLKEAKALEKRAQEKGISCEILSVETEDIVSAALSEAKKSYDMIFIVREKRKLFPLFERPLAHHLKKEVSTPIIQC